MAKKAVSKSRKKSIAVMLVFIILAFAVVGSVWLVSNQGDRFSEEAENVFSGLVLNYPKDWNRDISLGLSTASETTKLSSPGHKMVIDVEFGVAVGNGVCDISAVNLVYSKVEQLSGYVGYSLVSYVNSNRDGTYTYYVGVMNNNDVNYRGACPMDMYVVDVVEDGFAIQGLATITLTLNDVKNNSFETLQEFTQATESSYYDDAMQIIKTVHKVEA